MPPDTALLFAAGFGTRMAPLTERCPKPMIEVAGRPLFDHALDLVRDGGLRRVVANTHYLAELLSPHLARNGVIESHESVLLDTGGGLKRAARLTGGNALVTLNTDAVWTGANPVPRLSAQWDPARMDGLLVLCPRDRARGHEGPGDFVRASDGRLTLGRGAIYTGLQIVRTAPFLAEADDVFPMMRIWERMLRHGRLFGIVHEGGWCDVGRPESLPIAESMVRGCDA